MQSPLQTLVQPFRIAAPSAAGPFPISPVVDSPTTHKGLHLVAPGPKQPTERALSARDALVEANLAWAHEIARDVTKQLPPWFVEADLIGAADQKLVQVAEEFDPTRGVPFRAFARRRIEGACRNSIRRREYKERSHLSISVVPDNRLRDIDTPELEAGDIETSNILWKRVNAVLPPMHCEVILRRYRREMTSREVAKEIGLSEARVSQLHTEAFDMLRSDSLVRELHNSCKIRPRAEPDRRYW